MKKNPMNRTIDTIDYVKMNFCIFTFSIRFFSVPLALDLAHCVGFIHTDCVRKTFSSFYVDNCCVDVVVQLSCGG